MNQELLKKEIKKLVLSSVSNIYLFDVFNDEAFNYGTLNGELTMISKTTLTNFLEDIKNTIRQEDQSSYMSSISIPKLEEAIKEGNGKIIISYKTLNNKSFTNTCMLVNDNEKKYVLVISKQNTMKLDGNIGNDEKYNSLVDSLSDAILKIHNVFNLDEKHLSNTKNVEEYINSVFSSLTSGYPELKKQFNKEAANVSAREDDVILIVDDDALTRSMIKRVFKDEYKIVEKKDGKEALDYLEENGSKSYSSDHIIGIFLDLTMPVLDGFSVLDYLSGKNYLTRIPVIIISGDYEKETKARVYNYSIADMLEKPFDFDVVKHRIGNFINLYKSSNSLNNLINEGHEGLKDIIDTFVSTYNYDYKDSIKRVKEYINILGKQVMDDYPEYNIDSSNLDKIAEASSYYDIGFYSIPRLILSKNGNYTEEDITKIRQYPLFGSKMIDYVLSMISDEAFKNYAKNISLYYHENFDGTGFPSKLSGEKIPVEAQIASIAIAYNNLISRNDVSDIIVNKSGVMFNPKIVGSFMKVIDKFKNVK